MIVGITGRNCAGKDTIADYLEAHGFARYSLSDALREELRRRGETLTRANLTRLGNDLRAVEGPGTLAKRMLALLAEGRACLVSIRNPAEVEALRTRPDFQLWAVDAPLAERYRREMARGREDVPQSIEEFRERELWDTSSDPNGMDIDACMACADETIMNDGTIPELHEQITALLRRVERGIRQES